MEKMARAVCLFGGKWFVLDLCNEALMQSINCLDLRFHRLVSYILLQSIGIIYICIDVMRDECIHLWQKLRGSPA